MARNELAVREIESTQHLVESYIAMRGMKVDEDSKRIAIKLASKYIDASHDTLTQAQQRLDTLTDPLSLQDREEFGTIGEIWQETRNKLPGGAFRREKDQLAELRMKAIIAQREFRLSCPPPNDALREHNWHHAQSTIAKAIYSITSASFLAHKALPYEDTGDMQKYSPTTYAQSFKLSWQ